MTNWDYYEAVERFERILVATGISKTLKKRGAKEGRDRSGDGCTSVGGDHIVAAAALLTPNYTSHHLETPPGDLIMIGDQDFDFSSSNNVYVAAASAAAEHYRGKND